MIGKLGATGLRSDLLDPWKPLHVGSALTASNLTDVIANSPRLSPSAPPLGGAIVPRYEPGIWSAHHPLVAFDPNLAEGILGTSDTNGHSYAAVYCVTQRLWKAGVITGRPDFVSTATSLSKPRAVGYQSTLEDKFGTWLASDKADYSALVEVATTAEVLSSVSQTATFGMIPELANWLTSGYFAWAHANGAPEETVWPHFWNTSFVTVNLTALTAPERQLAVDALNAWHEVCNFNFTISDLASQITFDHNASSPFTRYIYDQFGHMMSAAIHIPQNWDGGAGTGMHSSFYQTYLHEIGHAVGLGHQGQYDIILSGGIENIHYGEDNVFTNDTWQWSVMSYFSQDKYGGASFDFATTPQMADIQAVINLYGAASTRTGNTTYGFHCNAGPAYDLSLYSTPLAFTIFDSDGNDTLDVSGYSNDQYINLIPGAWCSVGGYTSNIAIFLTTKIENAVGGGGNDLIIPNLNLIGFLSGGGGNDVFRGTQAGLDQYTITDIDSGDKINITDAVLASFSFTFSGTILSYGPYRITLSNSPDGTFTKSESSFIGVDLTFIAANEPPVAGNDVFSAQLGQTISGNVLANDSDPDGDPLTVDPISDFRTSIGGTVNLLTNGVLQYKAPTGGSATSDSFTYTVRDDHGHADSATVTITLTQPPNGPPSATDDTFSVQYGQILSQSVAGNDSDPDGDPLTYDFINDQQTAAGGRITLVNNGAFQYTAPASGSATSDSFTYTVRDDHGHADSATVTINLTNANHAPTIISDGGGNTATLSQFENTTAVTTVVATDPDAGDVLTYSILLGDDRNLFQINPSTGALSFITAPNFEAPADSDHNNSYIVQVQVADNGNPLFTDTQLITVNVTDVDEPLDQPEITVLGNGATIIADGDTSPSTSDGTDFGSVTQGTTVQRTFTVRNDGSATLTTSGLSLPSGFILVEPLSSSIAAGGGSDTFTVRLDTSTAGTKSGQISFTDNDSNENPFNFAISGTVTSDDFTANATTTGVVSVGGSVTGTLEIIGDHDWFRVQLTAGVQYTIDEQGDTVGAGTLRDPFMQLFNGSSQFITSDDDGGGNLNSRIVYTPSVSGTYYIDAGAFRDQYAGTYRVSVSDATAEITVSGGGTSIADGDTTPSSSDGTDFGSVTQGTTVQRTFMVRNDGSATLTTSGLSLPSGFLLVEGLSSSIAPGAADTFTVQLDTSTVGTKSGQISFTDNDSNENPFNFAITGTVTPQQLQLIGGDDFDANSKGDLAFQRGGNGVLWLNQTTAFIEVEIPGAHMGPEWTATGSGDFNGDDRADVLWIWSGNASIWLMNGSTLTQVGSPAGHMGAEWHVVDTGDFDADGKADIAWGNTTGQANVWFMDGVTLRKSGTVDGQMGAEWHIATTGDFNGDHLQDLLWLSNTGYLTTWLLDGTHIIGLKDFGPIGPAWNIAGTGDFNQDNVSDIVWVNSNNDVQIWTMNAGTISQVVFPIGHEGLEWHATDVADFTGDGRPDLLWLSSGDIAHVWLINGTQVIVREMRTPGDFSPTAAALAASSTTSPIHATTFNDIAAPSSDSAAEPPTNFGQQGSDDLSTSVATSDALVFASSENYWNTLYQ